MNIEKHDSVEQSNLENREEFGRNVTLVIDLIRHPEKDYETGNLKEEGKKAFLDKLNAEYDDPEQQFDTIKCYVSSLKRGQQAKQPLAKFLQENGINTKIRTRKELVGKMDQYSDETDKAMDRILEERDLLEDGKIQKEDAFEPISKDEESLKNEILIQEYFDRGFPESTLTGEEIGEELDSLIQHFAGMAQMFTSDSKVKIVSVGHGGVIEYLTKLVYLHNHPELRSEDVSVEEIGGLLDYMSGPRITITSDENGVQKAVLEFKDLSLDYEIKG
jgi:hypothetical protein